MIQYSIGSSAPAAHYFDINLSISRPEPGGQVLRLPAWIPGSYMIRDFARNIVYINASCEGKPVSMTQLDKSSWQLQPCNGSVLIQYRVYAWDLSVRSAHLDTTHGFFNGSSVFLEVVGQGEEACLLQIERPVHGDCKDWKLATTLARQGDDPADDDFSFGHFRAQNYLELIDHPVEMGKFEQMDFIAAGVRHDVVLTGKFNCDRERLKTDLSKICEQHISMFGAPAPMSRYMFLVMVVGEGYGGLEHRSSTSLVCSRYDLPQPGQSDTSEQYRTFLGLCSHEYFHSWNVKRIMPALFQNPDLSREIYTPLLWAFEGITSYYDDLALLRCGCIEPAEYLELLAQVVTRVQRNNGRKVQSAAESSFNAWSKFYKQDENANNAIVSYYAKGSLIALCIDLKIRHMTGDQKSLDDVMRILWQNYRQGRPGVDEQDIQNIICQTVDEDISDFLDTLIYQTQDLPIKELLSHVSIELDFRARADQLDKGGKEIDNVPAVSFSAQVKEIPTGLNIVSVDEKGSAQLAGLSAGDTIIAINGLRADMKSYQDWLKHAGVGSRHQVVAFRRDELMDFEVKLQPAQKDTAVLKISNNQNSSLASWLQVDPNQS